MRRYLFAALASIALIAAVPASSMARTHHHKSHKSSRRHHVRAHTRRFGDVNAPVTAPTSAPSSMDAGTVASFTPNSTNTGGTLVITLGDGHTQVSGQVTPDTEIECAAMNSSFSRDDGGPGPSGGGDQGNGGDDHGDNNDANDNNDEANNQACTSALTMGTVVREAELQISSGGAVWHKVELAS